MLTHNEKIAELKRCGLAYRRGSLPDAPSDHHLLHQTNCTSRGSAGLATIMFRAYPDANTYKHRVEPSRGSKRPSRAPLGAPALPEPGTKGPGAAEQQEPGTASVHSSGRVINLYAQYAPGPCPTHLDKDAYFAACGVAETYELRLAWLAAALSAARDSVEMPARFALPAGLGCDMAGGSWPAYADAIKAWADAHPDVELVFYVI
jgi:hypothetical protein